MRLCARILTRSLCLVACGAFPCSAKEWRGIVPLHTTRSEVIKLLGQPTHLLWDYRDYFIRGDEIIRFEWIDPTCARKCPVEPDSEVRPDDLVLSISVTLKKPIPIDELHLSSDKFYLMNCLGNTGCTHWDLDGGFSFRTTKNGVTGHAYGPATNEFKAWLEAHKACQASRERVEVGED